MNDSLLLNQHDKVTSGALKIRLTLEDLRKPYKEQDILYMRKSLQQTIKEEEEQSKFTSLEDILSDTGEIESLGNKIG